MIKRILFPILLTICIILTACKPEPVTQTPMWSHATDTFTDQLDLGSIQLTIEQDANQEYLPMVAIGPVTADLNVPTSQIDHYSYQLDVSDVTVSFDLEHLVMERESLQSVSDAIDQRHLGYNLILYFTNSGDLVPDENSFFNLFTTDISNVFLLLDVREMTYSSKLAAHSPVSNLSQSQDFYINQFKDFVVDFALGGFKEAIFWMRHEKLQDELMQSMTPCEPGVHWSCLSLTVTDTDGNAIPSASVRLRLGSLYMNQLLTDEFGKVNIPLNSARDDPSKGDLRKYDEFWFEAWANGFGTWDGRECKVFSAPYQRETLNITLPASGTQSCSGEMLPTITDAQPDTDQIIPPDFHMTISEHLEDWEWGVLNSSCEVKSSYLLDSMQDEKTAVLRVLSELTATNRGDCSWAVSDPEQIKVDVSTGMALPGQDMEHRFAGANTTPPGSTADMFNNLHAWRLNRQTSLSWNGFDYQYLSDNFLDQFTGIRIYREMITSRSKNDVADDLYCSWAQITSIETNAPIGGARDGYAANFPLMQSGCAYLEQSIQPPSGDPCIVARNNYDWMNEENADLLFQNYDTEGWSDALFQSEKDWFLWYFNEYDVRYTLNSCTVDWKSRIPPFSAKLKINVSSSSVYKGNSSNSNDDLDMYAVYRNGDWLAIRGYSMEDITKVDVPFVNKADRLVEVFWIDYDKNERSWFELQPGEQRSIGTSWTHMWSFYDKNTGERLLLTWIFPDQAPLIIREP